MPKISTFLNEDTIKNLKLLSEESGKSLSKVVAELIELGYKIKQLQDEKQVNAKEQKMAELAERHSEYLLKLIALT